MVRKGEEERLTFKVTRDNDISGLCRMEDAASRVANNVGRIGAFVVGNRQVEAEAVGNLDREQLRIQRGGSIVEVWCLSGQRGSQAAVNGSAVLVGGCGTHDWRPTRSG